MPHKNLFWNETYWNQFWQKASQDPLALFLTRLKIKTWQILFYFYCVTWEMVGWSPVLWRVSLVSRCTSVARQTKKQEKQIELLPAGKLGSNLAVQMPREIWWGNLTTCPFYCSQFERKSRLWPGTDLDKWLGPPLGQKYRFQKSNACQDYQ